MFLKICSSLLLLSATSATAEAADNNFVATTMALACPDASHVQVNDEGYTAVSKPRHLKKTEQRLALAYRAALANPYPVNTTGYRAATKVRVENGIIILE